MSINASVYGNHHNSENLKIPYLDKLGYIIERYSKGGEYYYYGSKKNFRVLGNDCLRVRLFSHTNESLYYETEIHRSVRFGNQKTLSLTDFLNLTKLEAERRRINQFLETFK